MKKYFVWIFILFFSFAFNIIPADAGQRDKRQKKQGQKYEQRDKRRDQKHPRYYGQGYRYNHHGRRHYRPKHYRGHWRSWRSWDDHRRHNHRDYRDGRYYRQDGSLYFEFENEDGRFVFSIGR